MYSHTVSYRPPPIHSVCPQWAWYTSQDPWSHHDKGQLPKNYKKQQTSCEELTEWKRLRCWEGLGAGREGDNRGWEGWMASLARWTWVWVNSRSWWWTGRPGVLQVMGSQSRTWLTTELNWKDAVILYMCFCAIYIYLCVCVCVCVCVYLCEAT